VTLAYRVLVNVLGEREVPGWAGGSAQGDPHGELLPRGAVHPGGGPTHPQPSRRRVPLQDTEQGHGGQTLSHIIQTLKGGG